MNAPDWLTAKVRQWMNRVGPRGWSWLVNVERLVHGDESAAGDCEREAPYNRVIFTFADYLTEDNEYIDEYVLHECLHAMHTSLDYVVEQVIIPQLPYEAREMAEEMYLLVYEQMIHELTLNLLEWNKERQEQASDEL